MPKNRALPTRLFTVALLLCGASPAMAADGIISLPEPSALFLLTLGVAGVAIGRKFSSKRPRD